MAESELYRRLPRELIERRSKRDRSNEIDDVIEVVSRCLHDRSRRSRSVMESKLRRRALLLAPPPQTARLPQAVKKKPRKRRNREAERTQGLLRENELISWAETAFMRRVWQEHYAQNDKHKHLKQADLHGAIIIVLAPSALRGICGVVIEESSRTFRLLDRATELFRIIPKLHLHFAILLEDPSPSLQSNCLILQGRHRNSSFASALDFHSQHPASSETTSQPLTPSNAHQTRNLTLAQQKQTRSWAPSAPLFCL